MPKKLYTFCCRLCLHDGSVNQLLDIYSVKGLDGKLLKVFNIQVTTQDSCTTNICLPCFQETLTLEQQMQHYQKHKHTILINQQLLKKNAPVVASGLSSTVSDQAQVVKCNQSEQTDSALVGTPKLSAKIHQTTSNNTTTDAKKQLNHSSNASTGTDFPKTKKHNSSSAKVKENSPAAQSSSKVPSSKKKSSDGSRKSRSKNPKSSPAVNKQQPPTVEPRCTTPKQTSGSLEKQSASKNHDSTIGQNPAQPTRPTKTVKDKFVTCDTTKSSGGNLETQSASKIHPPDATIGHNSVQPTRPTKPAKNKTVKYDTTKSTGGNLEKPSLKSHVPVSTKGSIPVKQMQPTDELTKDKVLTCIETPKCSTNAAQLLGSANNALSANTIVIRKSVQTISLMDEAEKTVPTVPGTAQSIEQNIPVHVINVQRTATQELNHQPQPLEMVTVENSSTTSKNPLNLPTTTQSQPALPVAQLDEQSAPSLVANRAGTFVPSQGTLCTSIPLANISATLLPYESRAVSSPSTVNQTGASSNTLATEGQHLAGTTNTPSNLYAEASANQPSGSSTILTNNATSAGTIKKRRHSTFIRVSSNLFDEPPEKAQFAMLNNNQFIRNIEPGLPNNPPTTTIPALPVLPPGLRVQIVPSPQLTMPFNNFSGNTMNRYPLFNNPSVTQQPVAPTMQNSIPTQRIATNFGINYASNFSPRTGNTLTVGQQPHTGSRLIQQSSVASNSNVPNNYSAHAHNSQFSSNAGVNRNMSVLTSQGTANVEPIRACYKCNICSSYYLLESSLVLHLRRVHQMEKSYQTCSVIYDPDICNKLMSRIRRKSIADPLLLSNNRT